ncbi:MAG: IPTL-CTERM sorting domain-containing protein [Nitrospirae bacterium]|nr:IPTL-CTERM sorting domain-containing protein [Nitrospirota bacterium]
MGRKLLFFVLAVCMFVVSFTAAAVAQDVAVVACSVNPAWTTEVQSKLVATGFFTTVDTYETDVATPTLAELQTYDAVLVFTDGGCGAGTLGDNLADYVDGGGGVVTAVFATASLPITGRFDTDNYWVIQPTGQTSGTTETLGTIFVPGHPILNGVASFSGGTSSYRPSADSLHPSATRIANWTGAGNIALIATREINGVRRADLGFFPPSTDSRSDLWVASTDGDIIMANALVWVSPERVPTMNEWGMIIFMALAGLGSIYYIRKHRRV